MTAVAQERAMAGAAAAGLSNRQKQLLCMKALKASLLTLPLLTILLLILFQIFLVSRI